jgi:hypothetical protein
MVRSEWAIEEGMWTFAGWMKPCSKTFRSGRCIVENGGTARGKVETREFDGDAKYLSGSLCRGRIDHSCLGMTLSAVLSIHEMSSVPRPKDVVLLTV